ncbi:short-chain dehydrogenases/reductases (SDR) family protein [Abortiporus biennis]
MSGRLGRPVAIITGASSGIGRATAISLSKAGWSLVLFARRFDQLCATKELCEEESRVMVFEGDVTNEESVQNLFKFAVQSFGRVDLLFNNAGVSTPAIPIEEFRLTTFQHVVNVNLVGSFLCTREAVKLFKSQTPPGGRIINNGSIAAHSPRPNSVAYTVTKHAITGLTKQTALDGRQFNITCTQVDIGNAATDMTGPQSTGILQADGKVSTEATFDVIHVAETIVHIASLPHDVTVLNFNIMATGMPFVGRG